MSSVNIVKIVFQLQSPTFHGSDEKTGSETLFRRLKFILDDGRIEEVPYISGNEVRGQLRRLTMRDFLKLVGYEVKSLRLYHALFSGGVLEEVEEKSTPQLDIELRRKIRKYLIPVSLFGFAILNQVIESKLKVMHALPICRELKNYLPEDIVSRYSSYVQKSFYEYLDWTFHTRHAEERRVSEEEPTVQMLYRFEVLIPGTLMYIEIVCDDCSDVELSCLARIVKLWQNHPYIGGKSSTGYGKIKFIEIHSDFEMNDSKYIQYIQNNKNEILNILKELDK